MLTPSHHHPRPSLYHTFPLLDRGRLPSGLLRATKALTTSQRRSPSCPPPHSCAFHIRAFSPESALTGQSAAASTHRCPKVALYQQTSRRCSGQCIGNGLANVWTVIYVDPRINVPNVRPSLPTPPNKNKKFTKFSNNHGGTKKDSNGCI